MIPTVQLSSVQVLAAAAAGVAAGEYVRRKVALIERLSIPGSIVGGLLGAAVVLALRDRWVNIQPDTVLRDVLMLACFTIIGLNASVRVIGRGGMEVVILLALATAGAAIQNAVGIGLAKAFGIHPLIGILAGAVSLAGGPATALAFGATFERAGVTGATTIALASATFGIAVSGLLAGTVGSFLIRRHRLRAAESAEIVAPSLEAGRGAPLMNHVLLIAVAMGLGSVAGLGIERAGFVLPAYIGAMVVAAAMRNADDQWGWFRISEAQLNAVFAVALPLFIVMAMLTLRLWEVAALAGPVMGILAAQIAVTWAMSAASFYALRRDHDAAVVATGYCGFMLGITANALATMGEVARRFGPAPRAFVVVPMVGAFLIDFTNAVIITVMANFVR